MAKKNEEVVETVEEKAVEIDTKAEKVIEEVASKPCSVISRANYPITIKIGCEEVIVSPRQRITVADSSTLQIKQQDAKVLRIIK